MNQSYVESGSPIATGMQYGIARACRLYGVTAVTLATFFGTPMAGAALLSINYRREGQADKARTALLTGLLATALAALIGYFLPQGMSLPLGIGLLFGMRATAQSLQGPMLAEHVNRGGSLESKWKAFGLSLVFLVGYCALIFLGVFLYLMSRHR